MKKKPPNPQKLVDENVSILSLDISPSKWRTDKDRQSESLVVGTRQPSPGAQVPSSALFKEPGRAGHPQNL